MRIQAAAAVVAAASVISAASAVAEPSPTPDPNAVAAIRSYVRALQTPDAAAAYSLLTKAQRRYFGNERNFGSNLTSTAYRIVSFAIARSTQRNPQLVEVDVDQTISFFDAGSQATATARAIEPYFALRDGDAWRVKELAQPWKSYAPKATGTAGGLVVVVDRIEFFDRRIQVDCTLRDLGAKPVQVLPLLKSTLVLGGVTYRALDEPEFPLDDRDFFEGARIYPEHQLVGWINFPVPARVDADTAATLTVAPIIGDGAPSPVSAVVGPMPLPRW